MNTTVQQTKPQFVNRSRRQEIVDTLADYPAIAQEILLSLHLPKKPADYQPKYFAIHFDDVLVHLQMGDTTVFSLDLPIDYKPTVIEFYGDSELLLVNCGKDILLNRLPEGIATTKGWISK